MHIYNFKSILFQNKNIHLSQFLNPLLRVTLELRNKESSCFYMHLIKASLMNIIAFQDIV